MAVQTQAKSIFGLSQLSADRAKTIQKPLNLWSHNLTGHYSKAVYARRMDEVIQPISHRPAGDDVRKLKTIVKAIFQPARFISGTKNFYFFVEAYYVV